MDTEIVTRPQAPQRSPEAPSAFSALNSVINEFITGGMPVPDNHQPPSPWDPVIRQALMRIRDHMGLPPRHSGGLGSVPDPADAISLNLQPLPPKALFPVRVAEEAVNHLSRLQDFADMAGRASGLDDFPRMIP